MKNLFMIWLVFCCCLAGHVKAQTDSTGCGVQLSIADSTDSSGITTFTAIYSGTTETNPFIEWFTSTGDYVVGTSYSTHIPSAGMQVNVNLVIYQPSEQSDSCYTTYSEYFYGDTLPPACNLEVGYTYVANANGTYTFTANYTGANNASLYWTSNDWYTGSGAVYTGLITSGTQVCVTATSHYTYYDAQHVMHTGTCSAVYCDTISAPQSDCDLQLSYTYVENPDSTLTFTAIYSGADSADVSLLWYNDYGYLGWGPVYTGGVYPNTRICVSLTERFTYFDSVQQTAYDDSCYAQFCQIIDADSVPEFECNATVAYNYGYNPDGTVTLTATYSGTSEAYLEWTTSQGQFLGTGPTYTGTLAPNTTVCVYLIGTNLYYNSQQQLIHVDSCYAHFCQTIYGDSVPQNGCNANVYFSYDANPSGPSTFTAFSTGVDNPHFQWFVNGVYAGDSASYSGVVADGIPVCVQVTGYHFVYDSLQQITQVDSCFAQYCETFQEDSIVSGNCTANVSFTSETNPSGVSTFTASYSGVSNPYFEWIVNGNTAYYGNGYEGYVAPGSEVCVLLTGYNMYYDSLTQETHYDTCYAQHCETFYTDTIQPGGCNANVYFNYDANPSGPSTFTAFSTGVDNPHFQWFVNGVYAGDSASYSGVVADGIPVCVQVTGYHFVYDSLQQITQVDSCFAQYCETFQQDSVVGVNCNANVSFTSVTKPNGLTAFGANYSGVANPQIEWIVNGSTVYYANGYEGYTAPGSEVCVLLTGYNVYYDSLTQETNYDACYVQHCEIFYPDTLQAGACNATVSYLQATDSTGLTTFAVQYTGADNPDFQWFVDGSVASYGASYTDNILSGTEICVVLSSYNMYYDSILQEEHYTSCYAQFCEVIYIDSLSSESNSAEFTYTYNPQTTLTTFTALDINKQQTEFTWLIDGLIVGHEPMQTALVAEDAAVCLVIESSAASTASGAISCKVLTFGTASLDEQKAVVYKLYPNPATDQITVSVSGAGKVQMISITDMYGRQVLTSTTLENINVSALSSGMYHIRALDAGGNTLWNEQLVKQ
jgi:hypothetical protein